ncbi:MAG: right-handed parallel beta-helix repeat-containing protein [Actinobacteria bacterium]|nr:right-handed parallel beta-helix repeat-containing protein [Actinomycetota bacterium]
MPQPAVLVVAAVLALLAAGLTIWVTRSPKPSPPRPPSGPSIGPWRQSWPAPDPSNPPLELLASPDGTGSTCSADAPCALLDARARARELAASERRDIVVRLADGTYPLAEPFVLDSNDSGRDGFRVSYEAAAGARPTLSGGTDVRDWALVDTANGIYAAIVDPALDSRQFFVNGARATRARGPQSPQGWQRTTAGFRAPDESMAAWRNPNNLEIVSFREWKDMRCPVASIAGRELTMAQPCWKNVNARDPNTMVDVTWVENAYELLDEPGEWYLDRPAGRLFYKPRPGEDLQTATAVLPTTKALLAISGSIDNPVRNVAIRGLTFSYNTWLTPSSPTGYPMTQAGWYLAGDSDPPDERDVARTEGAVRVAYATDIRFERNSFARLGSAALDFRAGSQAVGVVGNTFDDISSHAIQVGEAAIFADRPSDERDRLDRLDISNNLVQRAGAEYVDAVGILVTYASNVSILQNDVMHLPYTAISLGWGWGTDSYARRNVVRGNNIADFLRVLRDGGGVYTLSAQPGSVIDRNYIHDQVNPFGAIYLDEGTRLFTVTANVIATSPRWLHIWAGSIRDNVVVDNFSDTRELLNEGENIVLAGNQEGLTVWPEAARTIIDKAGLEPPYRDLRSNR